MSDFLEKNLEDIIYQNRLIIAERGFPSHQEHMIRQMRLPCGMIIDLFSYELIGGDEINCTIFELKKQELTHATLVQIANYAYEIKALLEPYLQKITINKVVVGNGYAGDFCVLYELMPEVAAYIYKYQIDGIKFEKFLRYEEIKRIIPVNDACGSGAKLLSTLLEKGKYLDNDWIEVKIPIDEYLKSLNA